MILKHNTQYAAVSSTLMSGKLPDRDILISIIIPTYNRFEMLSNAIHSAINQLEV
jgi:hypothetical protein